MKEHGNVQFLEVGITQQEPVVENTFFINSTNFSDIEWNNTVQVRVSKLVHFPYMRLYFAIGHMLAMDTNIHIFTSSEVW